MSIPLTVFLAMLRRTMSQGICDLHYDEVDPSTGLTLPTLIGVNGTQYWYKDEKLHRDEVDPLTGLTLPARIWADGTQLWYKEGKRLERKFSISKFILMNFIKN